MAGTHRDVSLKQVFDRVAKNPDLHVATLNLYHYSETQGAKGIAGLVPRLEKTHSALAEHLHQHAADEFRHAEMIGNLMAEFGAHPTPPVGVRYVDEFEALAKGVFEQAEPDEVEIMVGINVTEKRGLKSFALHVACPRLFRPPTSAPRVQPSLGSITTPVPATGFQMPPFRSQPDWLQPLSMLTATSP